MKKFKITFNKLYSPGSEVQVAATAEVIAASFKPVSGTNNGVCFFDENGHSISFYTNVDTVHQIVG